CTKGHRSATQNTFDACVKLARVERLRYVVVGSYLESDDAIDHGSGGRQHDDREIEQAFAQVTRKAQAVLPWHRYVQERDVDGMFGGQCSRGDCALGAQRDVAMRD